LGGLGGLGGFLVTSLLRARVAGVSSRSASAFSA
jgi:hypothetical protein